VRRAAEQPRRLLQRRHRVGEELQRPVEEDRVVPPSLGSRARRHLLRQHVGKAPVVKGGRGERAVAVRLPSHLDHPRGEVDATVRRRRNAARDGKGEEEPRPAADVEEAARRRAAAVVCDASDGSEPALRLARRRRLVRDRQEGRDRIPCHLDERGMGVRPAGVRLQRLVQLGHRILQVRKRVADVRRACLLHIALGLLQQRRGVGVKRCRAATRVLHPRSTTPRRRANGETKDEREW